MSDLEADAEERIGSTFEGYRLEKILGVGGMATVFSGVRADGAPAALKLLHPPLNAIDEVKTRFLREGSIGEQLGAATRVPGLPVIYGSGVAKDGTAYLVMEQLAGEALFDRMARLGTLPIPEALFIAEQVLDVLEVAHAHGIVHRDIKPENLHVLPDGRIKVLDFGIARVLEAIPSSIQGLPEMTATRTGITIGTTEYMSPEQATGVAKEIDGRTDLFGLGATIFRLLAGRTVHGGEGLAEMLIAAATKQAPPLARVAPQVPADICAAIDIALAFEKDRRYPDARTMRTDIRALRVGAPPPYARAVGEGRLQQGAPLGGALVGASDEVVYAPRAVASKKLAPATKLALVVGVAALVFGVGMGVVIKACSDDPRPPRHEPRPRR
jgi:eukaryotic-like serine/threonine-protein kinase